MNEADLECRIDKPIFVIGCPCSGTTLLWNILKSNPNISGPEIEGQDLEGMPSSMTHHLGKSTFMLWAINGNPYWLDDGNPKDKEKIIEVYSKYLEPGKRFCDKSPAHTARVRGIQANFPDSYFVGIVRDPYATVPSIMARREYDERYPDMKGLNTKIDQAANQWSLANTMLLAHEKGLNKIKIVKYEDLVSDPSGSMGQIALFLELENEFTVPEIKPDTNEKRIKGLSRPDVDIIYDYCKVIASCYDYQKPAV